MFSRLFSNKKRLTNIAYGSAAIATICAYPTLINKWAEAEVKFFKRCLTAQQLKEMEDSPEKRKEFIEEHKKMIRASRMID